MSLHSPLRHDDPERVGPFTLLARLGGGGMGTVFLARSAGGRIVALKTVHARFAREPEFRARFRLEAAAARVIGARHGAAVVDADTQGALPWLATDYVLGPALADAVAVHGPLPEAAVRALGAALGRALDDIHRAGLVHRDLKPSNVLVTVAGPRVIDFGIARALGARRLTRTGQVFGTPSYMSPEQAAGREHGPPGDVFALAGVLVYAATGHGPFPGEEAADVLYRIRYSDPDLRGLPDALRAPLERCLAKEPGERPGPGELAGLLAAPAEPFAELLPGPVLADIARRSAAVWQAAAPVRLPAPEPGAVPPVPGEEPPRGLSRRRLLVGGGIAVAAAGGAAWAAYRFTRPGAGAGGRSSPKPSRAPGLGPEPRWTYRADDDVKPVALADGVLVLSGEEALYGVDTRTGKELWQGPARTVTVLGDRLLARHVTSLEAAVLILAPRTGKLSPASGELREPPLLTPWIAATGDPEVAYLTTSGPVIDVRPSRDVAAYEVRTGRRLWLRSFTGRDAPRPFPAAVAQDVLVCSDGDHGVVGLDRSDGSPRWRRTVFTSADAGMAVLDTLGPATAAAGRVHVAGPDIVALEAATGRIAWRWGADRAVDPQPAQHFYGAPRVADGVLYVVAIDGARPGVPGEWMYSLIALDAATARPLWSHQYALPSDVDTAPVVHRGMVYVGTADPRQPLLAVDTRTHRPPWSFRPTTPDGSAIGGLLLGDGTLYVAHGATVSALPVG
ncbi:PQQ-binding-like beta-propeller repeat protein [Streptomyces sp. NPDC045431]|uniref:serine/threonine-protein kinase n=1 Tax=Streptomyces sp. NPDC045431 TaxID=3155613 RepID=UPI0033F9D5A3